VVKRWFNKKQSSPSFKEGDLVFKYDKRAAKPSQNAKFDTLWKDPFHIINCKEKNTFKLEDMEGNSLSILMNGIHLNIFN
jgi:hypothetical protein